MKRALLLLVVGCVLWVACCGAVWASIEWQEISRGIINVRAVLVEPDNNNVIFIGTDKGVYKSEDGGASWRNTLSVRGDKREVNFLLVDPADKNYLYTATGGGLFYSRDKGTTWKRIFKGKNSSEFECSAVAVLPSGIYLGTMQGLFLSKDRGRSWQKQTGKIGNSRVFNIAYNFNEPNYVYVSCVDGIFKSADSGKTWERIFVSHPVEDGDDPEETNDDQDEEQRFSQIRYLSTDPNNLNRVYLATEAGIYISGDRGESWNAFSDFGLLSKDVKFILVSNKSRLFVSTKSGIFESKNERWEELSLSLVSGEVNFLALDNQNNLYAACEKGLFKSSVADFGSAKQESGTAIYHKDEPKISEVQQAAVRYAEVEPEKIFRWRRQAAKRALLPKLSVGMDIDKDRTISRNIWGIYSSYSNGSVTAPGRYYIGPDDETSYDNRNWSVSLTWELGDLIWSDDQTNIDVRSRLMVQLRDDILDEVTKLYFERLRVKMELDNLSIEERKKRFEKELRLEELTASIDGLTGGYFSQQVRH